MRDVQTKVIVGTAVAAGTFAVGLAYLYIKKLRDPIPTRWKKVGKIIDLNLFPVKSCAPIKRESFNCHMLGFECEGVYDRCFVVVSQNKREVTASSHPKLVLVRPEIIDNQLILSAPGIPNFVLDLNELRKRSIDISYTTIQLYAAKANGIDAGDDVANWFSQYIADKPDRFRLIFYPKSYPTKPKAKIYNKFKAMGSKDVGIYHFDTSYMLANQSSVDELNTHLDHVVTPLQFRPNIVIAGPKAYEEDNFKWVRIGENVILRGVKPCFRCIIINVNPETGERHPQHEPMKTMNNIRASASNPKDGPVMGLELALRSAGKISIGDDIYVNDD